MVGLVQNIVITDRRCTLGGLKPEVDPAQRGITCTGTFRCKCSISERAEILMSPRSHQHVPRITMRPWAVLHILFHVRAVGVLLIQNTLEYFWKEKKNKLLRFLE